jgi:putative toxin-antitoxin system antitoxin component (TIGR02293 family)
MASSAERTRNPEVSYVLPLDLESVETGLPLAALTLFVASSGLRLKDIYEIVIPARTLKHRKARKEALSLDESDRFARLVRVYSQAAHTFGDSGKTIDWLNQPKQRFAGRNPIQMLRTEIGGRMIEEMLGQIDEGMFA